MNYNYYFFLLENYRKKMNPNLDVLSIRKAVYQSYSNESLRQRQRYRHEMAKERRARMESQKLMNLKLKELKEKEKEISHRYARRNNYGSVIGPKSLLKSKFEEDPKDESITVLLPVLKKKDGPSRYESSFEEGLDYGSYSIPKTMLPPGNEDICAYEVAKAAQEICAEYKNKDCEDVDCDLENGVRSGIEAEDVDKGNPKQRILMLTPANNDGETILPKEKSVKCKGKPKKSIEPRIVPLPSYKNRKHSTKQQISSLPKHNFGPSYYQSFIDCHPYDRVDEDGNRLASLTVFGKAKKTNTYELLIVDDGPRSEEIRVKQKSCHNQKPFDILIIREKLSKSPNTWRQNQED